MPGAPVSSASELLSLLEEASEEALEWALPELLRRKQQLRHCLSDLVPARSEASACSETSEEFLASFSSDGIIESHRVSLSASKGVFEGGRDDSTAEPTEAPQRHSMAPSDASKSTVEPSAAPTVGREPPLRTRASFPTQTSCQGFTPSMFKAINGILFCPFVQPEAVRGMQSLWTPESGDVFVVSHFPLRGLQRMMVALVEGQPNPWEEGLIDKPHSIEGGPSRLGPQKYIEAIASWHGRRCFKSHCFPHMFPARWPLQHDGKGVAPKVVVFVADPRYAISIAHEVWGACIGSKPGADRESLTLTAFMDEFMTGRFQPHGDYFAHCAAWAREAAASPGTVRLFVAERFASCDPKEVLSACEELAEFLEMPAPARAAAQIAAAMMERPPNAAQALSKDCLVPREAVEGGPLIELVGPRLQGFQESIGQVSQAAQIAFMQLLHSWMDGPDQCLIRLAEMAARGSSSLPPARIARPMKGEALHDRGECRPCVFALRGACRDSAAMCAFCHAPGHAKLKRASRGRRTQRRIRMRTPSPEGLSS